MKLFARLLLVVLAIAMAGLGCKGLSKSEQAAVRPVALTYWTVYNDVETLRALAAEYKRQRPYVTVTIQQVRYEEFDTLFVNALADDSSPDIVSIHARSLPKYQNRLATMPANVRVSNVTVKGKYAPETVVTTETLPLPSLSTIRSQFVATVGADAIRGNDVYGLPLAIDTLAIYYNKDLLDRSGIALPPATWDEFLAAVEKTTRVDAQGNIAQSGVALGTGTNIEYAADILALLMLQKGVSIMDGGQVTFANGLQDRDVTNHPSLETLRFYTDFARDTKKIYTWNNSLGNALDAFVRGQSVFYVGFAYDRARIRARAPQLTLDVIPVPQLDPLSPVNVVNYWLESVVKKSTHQEEAWDFIRFITLPQNIKTYTDATGQPSPLRIHNASQLQDTAIAPFAATALVAANWYQGRNVYAAEQAFRDMIEQYRAPYGENQDPLRRDAGIINQAAAVVQQTL